ncbi:helix-turn-helix domain-containing protein [Paenibacillus sp. Soil787]|uniref:helix-turn-helix domain-containing protein n=1 Tax=Paenibacillus sp. Soil787 TaxID=1736411 RepID=UPI0006F8A263|nr:helix-turn-helix transcriptional regulator [Paenibacillus sp. Soil787]KRF31706.1 hypothetical protein ASG93_05045 [Paenibacillus sp. Soil787]
MQQYEIYKVVGNKIKQLRLAQGMTPTYLANRINLSRPSIINIENGVHRIQLHTLIEITNVLDVNLYTLLDGNYSE